jgi:dUTP pyrophosphatase
MSTNSVKIQIDRLEADAILPKYAHLGDAGADLYASVDRILAPLERAAIPTGLAMSVPLGYEVQVRPKSGLALHQGLTVLNSPGTIDSGYRGEVQVLLINLSDRAIEITKGQKIAQMVVAPVCVGEFEVVTELSNSDRGLGGFGSTGLK